MALRHPEDAVSQTSGWGARRGGACLRGEQAPHLMRGTRAHTVGSPHLSAKELDSRRGVPPRWGAQL